MTAPEHLVLANANAGSTARDAVSSAVARIAEDAPVRVCWTESSDGFREAVKAADGRRIVVAGGDGSINLALGTLAELGRTDQAVGIVPLGTGNDFARNHDLPLDPVEAAERIVAGQERPVAAMVLETIDERGGPVRELVANNLHVGLGVDAARTASSWKRFLGKASYPVATAYRGVSPSPLDVRLDVDGADVWSGPVLAVLVLLGPSMGGGIEVTDTPPVAIDVVMVEPTPLAERPAMVRAALTHRLADHPDAHRWPARRITVRADDPLRVNADGELRAYGPELTLTHQPDAWRVLV